MFLKLVFQIKKELPLSTNCFSGRLRQKSIASQDTYLMIIGLKDVLGIADSTQYKILAVDRSRIAVLPNDTSDFWIFPAGLQVVLTNDDFQEIEQVLDSTINSYNAKQNLSYKKMVEKYPNLTVDKEQFIICLLYTSDAADDLLCVDLG